MVAGGVQVPSRTRAFNLPPQCFFYATFQASKLEIQLQNTTKLRENSHVKIQLGEAHEEIRKTKEWIKKESENKDKTINELRASVAAYELKTESLYSEVSKLQAQIEITEEEKRELREEVLDVKRRVHDAVVYNRQASEENEELNLEIQSFYKRRLSELQASYIACENEKHDFQHQTTALKQKVTKLEAELEEAINERSACELRVQELATTCACACSAWLGRMLRRLYLKVSLLTNST